MAAPFGPPPVRATMLVRPSGATRVSVPRRISTTSTLPSGSATGPSGNWRPVAISRISVIPSPPPPPPTSRRSFDRDERTTVGVELVQVLRDPEPRPPLVSPAREALVDERSTAPGLVRDRGDAKHLAAKRVHAPPRIGGVQLRHAVRETVLCQRRVDVPAADARRGAVTPHPAAVEVSRLGADPDAAEVNVVAEVDREPAPHAWPPPAARSPGLVPVPARVVERVAVALGLEPAGPAPCLLEVPLADARTRRGGRAAATGALGVDADRRCEGAKRGVEPDARRARVAMAGEVAHPRLRIRRHPPLAHRAHARVADSGDVELAVGHLPSRRDRSEEH